MLAGNCFRFADTFSQFGGDKRIFRHVQVAGGNLNDIQSAKRHPLPPERGALTGFELTLRHTEECQAAGINWRDVGIGSGNHRQKLVGRRVPYPFSEPALEWKPIPVEQMPEPSFAGAPQFMQARSYQAQPRALGAKDAQKMLFPVLPPRRTHRPVGIDKGEKRDFLSGGEQLRGHLVSHQAGSAKSGNVIRAMRLALAHRFNMIGGHLRYGGEAAGFSKLQAKKGLIETEIARQRPEAHFGMN